MIKLAFIGCGGIARQHIAAAMNCPDAAIVGYCDPSPNALELVRALAPAAAYHDWDELLTEARPDAVVVSVPHSLHVAAITAALRHGAHVLCEKPLAPSAAEARQLVELAQARGRLLGLRYQCHADGAWGWIQRHVAAGAFGPVHYVQALLWQNWVGEGWRGDPDLACGGELNDAGSHLVDAMLWSTGLRPTAVTALTDNRDLRVERLASLSFRFAGGLGSLSIVGETAEPGYDSTLEVWCRDARVSLRGFSDGTVAVNGRPVPRMDMPPLPDEGVGNFIRAIHGEAPLQAAPECGVLVAAFTAAAYQSAREGRVVPLGRNDG
ncbi:MAG TPA: Gfo/Idh/MocA family oxidoreductase [Chloroflexota bacterium]|nr:Gfo/Idh/MocA family oxidoreductase [Chloroflexota bacterium]